MEISCCLIAYVPLLTKNIFHQILLNIEKISKLFQSFPIYLYLDPKLKYSIQQLELIYEFQNKLNIHLIQTPNTENPISIPLPIYTPQINNIEFGLNYILDLIDKNTLNHTEYIIIMDMSDYLNTLTLDTNILKTYLNENHYEDNNGLHYLWDIITFHNSTYHNYNTLSISDFQYYCWKWDNPYLYIDKLHQFYQDQITNAKSNTLFIDCDSAFNGLAIYRTAAIQHCSLLRHFSQDKYDFKKINQLVKKLNINYLDNKDIPDNMYRGLNFMAKRINKAKIKIATKPIYEPSPITSFNHPIII